MSFSLRTRMKKMVWLVVVCFAMMANNAVAQSTTEGAVGGSVVDTQGAVVPNAKVTVHNLETNTTDSTTTDGEGRFRVIHLRPGRYEVTIEAQNFAPFKQQSLIVEVGRVSDVEAKLAVGGGSETVNVTAEAPVVNTEQQDFSTNLNQTSINELPINGRRWSNFAVLTPGVVPDGNFGLLSFRGISGLLNNNTIDGGDNNQAFFSEERGRTRISYVISQDSIREFQVNTSNYSAEYGRAAGGVVNAVTKSGTNAIHGSAFYFDRDNNWGATNPFTTAAVNVNGNFVVQKVKPPDRRHQFGASLGGPIIKDHLFYFFSYDQQKRNFPGNAIPSSPGTFLAGPTSNDLTSLMTRLGVSASTAQTDFNNGLALIQSLTGPVPRRGDQIIFLPKIDWTISKGETFSAVYNRMRWTSPAGIQTQATNNLGTRSFGNDYVHADSATGKLVSLLTPNISNEARFTYARDNEFEFTQTPNPQEPKTGPGGTAVDVTINNAGGTFEFGKPVFLDRRALPDESRYQYFDAATFAFGKHLVKVGVDINHVNDVEDNLRFESGSYTYNSRVDFFTDMFATATSGCTTTTAPIVKIGCYNRYDQGFGPTAFEFQTNDYNFFGQDDWRLLSRLTLNLGLRYEYEQLPTPQLPNRLLPKTSQFPSQKNNFGPRVGFAWDVYGTGKTSLRGGYGVYYGRILNSTIANAITNTGLPTSQIQVTFFPTTSGSATPGQPFYPNTLTSGTTTAKPNVVEFASNFRTPLIQQADLVLEQQFGANMVFSASYLLSLGRHLPNFIDVNFNRPTQSLTYTVAGGPFNGQQFTTPLFTGARPNANFNSITDVISNVNSSYNGLVLQLNRRLAHGLQLQSSYTWSHAIDQGQGSQTFTATNVPLTPFNQALDKSSSNFDVRHRVVVSSVWSPPEWKSDSWVAKWLVNGFEIAPVFVASTSAPRSGTVSGSAPGSTAAGQNGSSGSNRIFFIPRNSYTTLGLQNLDLRVAKSFKPTERVRLQLIGEAFNLFNHTNFSGFSTHQFSIGTIAATNPNGGCPAFVSPGSLPNGTNILCFDPTFLTPSGAQSTLYRERNVQIGARLTF